MKLLFISQYIYTPDQPAANRIYDFLQLLARRGHQPIAIAGGVHYLEDRLDPELARRKVLRNRWGHVPVILTYAAPDFRRRVTTRLWSYLTFAWYAALAAIRVGPVDAVMVSVQPMIVAPLGWLVSWFRRAPFFLEVRDLWPDAAVEVGLIRSSLLVWLGHRLEAFLYRRARHIIAISPGMKRTLERKGVPAAKIEVVPQGFQPSYLPRRPRAVVRSQLGLDDRFVLMFAGSFGLANNDVHLIVDAAERLHTDTGVVFVMVGEGDQKPACVDRCRRAQLTNVRFLPMVPKKDVHSLLGAADACVMTLPRGDFWKMCLQNKIFDYMGLGLPVVAAVAGDQADLLRRAEAGIVVQPGDLDGLVESVLALKGDPDLRRRLGANGARYVRAHLMREQLLDRYLRLIERLVDDPKVPLPSCRTA